MLKREAMKLQPGTWLKVYVPQLLVGGHYAYCLTLEKYSEEPKVATIKVMYPKQDRLPATLVATVKNTQIECVMGDLRVPVEYLMTFL